MNRSTQASAATKEKAIKKLDKTAAMVERCAKNLKPSLKVKVLYKMFLKLHLNDKLWKIDNEYWQEHKKKRN